MNAYIPVQGARKRDPDFSERERFRPKKKKKQSSAKLEHYRSSDFQYDSEKDSYTCPAGETLKILAHQAKGMVRKCPPAANAPIKIAACRQMEQEKS